MKPSQKQLKHYRNIAQQSLNKFKKIADTKYPDEITPLIEKDWQSFIDDESRLLRYVTCVTNVGGILGFSRELSSKLNLDELAGRVAERFAEVDLAEHVIRELALDKTGGKLTKLSEGESKRCDFQLFAGPSYYFEAKYTKKITGTNLVNTTREALEQIKSSMKSSGEGCIWIFTYTQPPDPRIFQDEVMLCKERFSDVGFQFKLNVQVYGSGLFGDAVVI